MDPLSFGDSLTAYRLRWADDGVGSPTASVVTGSRPDRLSKNIAYVGFISVGTVQSAARMAASLRSTRWVKRGAPRPRGPNRLSALLAHSNGKRERWHRFR